MESKAGFRYLLGIGPEGNKIHTYYSSYVGCFKVTLLEKETLRVSPPGFDGECGPEMNLEKLFFDISFDDLGKIFTECSCADPTEKTPVKISFKEKNWYFCETSQLGPLWEIISQIKTQKSILVEVYSHRGNQVWYHSEVRTCVKNHQSKTWGFFHGQITPLYNGPENVPGKRHLTVGFLENNDQLEIYNSEGKTHFAPYSNESFLMASCCLVFPQDNFVEIHSMFKPTGWSRRSCIVVLPELLGFLESVLEIESKKERAEIDLFWRFADSDKKQIFINYPWHACSDFFMSFGTSSCGYPTPVMLHPKKTPNEAVYLCETRQVKKLIKFIKMATAASAQSLSYFIFTDKICEWENGGSDYELNLTWTYRKADHMGNFTNGRGKLCELKKYAGTQMAVFEWGPDFSYMTVPQIKKKDHMENHIKLYRNKIIK